MVPAGLGPTADPVSISDRPRREPCASGLAGWGPADCRAIGYAGAAGVSPFVSGARWGGIQGGAAQRRPFCRSAPLGGCVRLATGTSSEESVFPRVAASASAPPGRV